MLKKLRQRRNPLAACAARSRFRNSLVAFRYTHCIHDKEAIFCRCVRCNLSELVIAYYPASSSLHLRVENFGLNIIHKQDNFEGLNVRSCCNQGYRHSNSEFFFISQLTNQSIRITGRVCDLFNKSIRNDSVCKLFGKDSLYRINYLGCMVVILGKNQGFGNVRPVHLPIRI